MVQLNDVLTFTQSGKSQYQSLQSVISGAGDLVFNNIYVNTLNGVVPPSIYPLAVNLLLTKSGSNTVANLSIISQSGKYNNGLINGISTPLTLSNPSDTNPFYIKFPLNGLQADLLPSFTSFYNKSKLDNPTAQCPFVSVASYADNVNANLFFDKVSGTGCQYLTNGDVANISANVEITLKLQIVDSKA